jgi:hypothetical protein
MLRRSSRRSRRLLIGKLLERDLPVVVVAEMMILVTSFMIPSSCL